ncbi:MAG: GAF domain-containing protein [Candidatus Thermoplasmatota archaeon]
MDYKRVLEVVKQILAVPYPRAMQDVVELLQMNFKHYNWVGIYLVEKDRLVLGPWYGRQETEHKIIPLGKGVCGAAAFSGKTEIVPDVSKDKRYLSCFLSTKSEIVVPIIRNKKVIGEIDIDSDRLNAFALEDKEFLERIADMLSTYLNSVH